MNRGVRIEISRQPMVQRDPPSSWPALDAFVRSCACRGGVVGGIRCWSCKDVPLDAAHANANAHADADDNANTRQRQLLPIVVTYQISNNRWCENIGRAHKSNHIYIEIHVQRGQWRQRCHDPDCARSGRMPAWHDAPPEVLPRGYR